MKKFVLVFLLASNFLVAQNWTPISSSNVYNYFTNNNFSSAATIKTDSTKIIGSDTVYYLNRIVVKLNQTKRIKNEGQFLNKYVINRPSGYITFKGDNDFTLKPYENTGVNWIFDSISNTTASITSIMTNYILGNIDSIKTIVTSASDTIILSKNYGITAFKRSTNNVNYKLEGIENLNLGFRIPSFFDFFNYNVGDTLQYRYHDHYFYASNQWTSQYDEWGVRTQIITSKNVYADSLKYTITQYSGDTTKSYFSQFNISTNIITKTLLFKRKNYDFLNSHNNAMRGPAKCGEVYQLRYSYDVIFNCNVKSNSDSTLSLTQGEDTLRSFLPYCWNSEEYGDNRGLIHGKYWDYTKQNQYSKYLQASLDLLGASINGVRYGNISVFMNNIGLIENSQPDKVAIYPTVFSGKLSISCNGIYIVNITDLLGRVLYTKYVSSLDDSATSLDLSFLENGNYLISLTDSNQKRYTKKVIKVD